MADDTETSGITSGSGKRRYVRPTLRRVKLRAEEAVLGNCKTGTIVGPGQSAGCDVPTSCFVSGS